VVSSNGIRHEDDPALNSAYGAEAVLFVVLPVIEPIEASLIVKDERGIKEVDPVFGEVGFRLGLIPFE